MVLVLPVSACFQPLSTSHLPFRSVAMEIGPQMSLGCLDHVVCLLLQLTAPGHGVQRTISRHRIWVSVLLGLPGHRVLSMNGVRGGVRRSEGQTVPLPLCLDRSIDVESLKPLSSGLVNYNWLVFSCHHD